MQENTIKPEEKNNSETSDKKSEKLKEEKWGFDLYPERRGGRYKPSLSRISFFGEGREAKDRLQCEEKVWNVVQKSPLIKLLLGALNSSGCPIDIERHIACEVCDITVLGGYDQELNQIVICQNVCNSEGRIQNALAHELIHMFDYCRNKLDFTNIDHVACTEIKAANLTSCSFFTAMSLRTRNHFSVKETHKECVKTKAAWSLKHARNISEEEARQVIEKVFPKCYNDLEPLGRRPRRNSYDLIKAYKERAIYGYE